MNLKQMSCKNGMSMEMPMAMAGIRHIILLQGGHKRLIPGQWGKQSSIFSPQCIMWHSLTVLCDVKQPKALVAGNVNTAKLCMIKTATLLKVNVGKNVGGGYGKGQFMGFLPVAPAQLDHYKYIHKFRVLLT